MHCDMDTLHSLHRRSPYVHNPVTTPHRQSNHLGGDMPDSLSELTGLKTLRLGENRLGFKAAPVPCPGAMFPAYLLSPCCAQPMLCSVAPRQRITSYVTSYGCPQPYS